MTLIDFRSPRVYTYKLELAGVFLAVSSVPLLFLTLGWAFDLANSVRAALLLLFMVVGLVFRYEIVDRLYKISPRPVIENPWGKAIVALASFILLALTQQAVVLKELAIINSTDQIAIVILGGSSLSEETVVRFGVFFGVWVAGIRLVRNYWIAAVIAIVMSSVVFYGFHFYVYGDLTKVLLFVFLSGVNLCSCYFLTGALSLVMVEHFWWNTGGLWYKILGPVFGTVFLSLLFAGLFATLLRRGKRR